MVCSRGIIIRMISGLEKYFLVVSLQMLVFRPDIGKVMQWIELVAWRLETGDVEIIIDFLLPLETLCVGIWIAGEFLSMMHDKKQAEGCLNISI